MQPQNQKDALVAQLVEHLTLNQGVQGSTPCRRTKCKKVADSKVCHFSVMSRPLLTNESILKVIGIVLFSFENSTINLLSEATTALKQA